MTGLIVQGISVSFCFICVSATVAFSVLCDGILYRPVALTTFMLLSGGSDMWPCAGPLPLL